MKKRYIIYCEMDYDYLKEVSITEILPDGTESRISQSLPVKKGSYTGNEYVLEIDIPENNVLSNSDEIKINSIFGLTLSEIKKRIDFYERHKYDFAETETQANPKKDLSPNKGYEENQKWAIKNWL